MTQLTITAIEDAMKARILAASRSGELGYRLKTVATYDAEFDDLDKLAQVLRALPAVWVVLARSGKPERKGADKWLVPVTMAVMVGARSVRNHEAARKGDAAEPGTYRMLDDMWDLFVGQDLGLRMGAFTPGETVTVFQARVASQGISVLGLELHTTFTRTGSASLNGEAPELREIGITYYLQPGDDEPDAADAVTLGTEEDA